MTRETSTDKDREDLIRNFENMLKAMDELARRAYMSAGGSAYAWGRGSKV